MRILGIVFRLISTSWHHLSKKPSTDGASDPHRKNPWTSCSKWNKTWTRNKLPKPKWWKQTSKFWEMRPRIKMFTMTTIFTLLCWVIIWQWMTMLRNNQGPESSYMELIWVLPKNTWPKNRSSKKLKSPRKKLLIGKQQKEGKLGMWYMIKYRVLWPLVTIWCLLRENTT